MSALFNVMRKTSAIICSKFQILLSNEQLLAIITMVPPPLAVHKYVISHEKSQSLFFLPFSLSSFLPFRLSFFLFLLQSNYFSPEWFGLPAIHDSFLVYLLNLRPVFSSFHFHVGRGKSPSISWQSFYSFSPSYFRHGF